MDSKDDLDDEGSFIKKRIYENKNELFKKKFFVKDHSGRKKKK